MQAQKTQYHAVADPDEPIVEIYEIPFGELSKAKFLFNVSFTCMAAAEQWENWWNDQKAKNVEPIVRRLNHSLTIT